MLRILRDIEVQSFAWNLDLWRHLNFSFSVPVHFTADDFCVLLPWLLLSASQPYLCEEGNVTKNKSYAEATELIFSTTVNFEITHFLNEETEGVLTDTYSDEFPWLAPIGYVNSNLMLRWNIQSRAKCWNSP